MPIAWVASYPKSGNTWARILLSSYLRDESLQFRVHEMGTFSDTVTDLIDAFQQGRMLPLDEERELAVKTHFLPGAEVHSPYREVTGKVLYVVRNPRDVLHSSERFLYVGEQHRTEFAKHFIEHRGVAAWRRVGYGSWPQHVLDWTSPDRLHRHFPGADVCVVRYEDMKQDTAGTLHKMLDFLDLGAEIDPDRVQRAVQNSSLKKMQENEKSDTQRGKDMAMFFGSGLSEQSLADYGEDVEEAYQSLLHDDAEFAAVTEQYGYAR